MQPLSVLPELVARSQKDAAAHCKQDLRFAVNTHGAWCLVSSTSRNMSRSSRSTRKGRIPLARGHLATKPGFVQAVRKIVPPSSSINDIGAGVGQLGHELLAQDPSYVYAAFDGSGNVEHFTNNFVRFADFTLPWPMPVADWVISTEVGEHIPRHSEKMYFYNLHMHNRRGIILSWAALDQGGNGHVNTHTSAYVTLIFSRLGYIRHKSNSAQLQMHHDNVWVFVRERSK